MRVEISEQGNLVISTDKPLEKFALTQWFRMWCAGEATFLITGVERSQDDPRELDTGYNEVVPRKNGSSE